MLPAMHRLRRSAAYAQRSTRGQPHGGWRAAVLALPCGAIGNNGPANHNPAIVNNNKIFVWVPSFPSGNSCIYSGITMSDSDPAGNKPTGMHTDAAGSKTKDDGVPVVMTLPAGARVGDVINNLIYLPGGRTRTLSTTVTQDDIYAGRVSRMMPDLAAE